MELKRIGVKLSAELDYSSGGDFKKTAELEFCGPTMASFDEASDLSQMVMNALMDAGKNAPAVADEEEDSSGKKNADMDADAIRITLMTAERVKFKDVAKCFRKLALKCGTFDGKEPLTDSVFNKLTIDDFTLCICEYVANFIVPSLLSGREGESEQSGSGTA